jgi:hypothetical protein
MDDHHPEAINYKGPPTIFHPAPSPYGIPYRCLYSKNIENLFFAGRNISATHMALSSTRVMGTCAILGQAVGTAAAIAVREGLSPRGVYQRRIGELQDTLMEQDCYLPWHTREIPELCRHARLDASQGDPEILLNGTERNLDGTDNGWWADAGDWLEYIWDEPVDQATVRVVLDSDLADAKRMPCRYPRDRHPVKMPAMLARDFDVGVRDADGHWTVVAEIRDNRKRLISLSLSEQAITGCRLRIGRAWGGEQAHVFAFDVQAPS